MKFGIKTKRFCIGGMTCIGCEAKIERKLLDIAGVEKAEVSYRMRTALVSYDISIVSQKTIAAVIEQSDYWILSENERKKPDTRYIMGILVIIAVLYFRFERMGLWNMLVPLQMADSQMGYGMLFVIGLLTSVHCIAMCGGINLSQCIPTGKENTGSYLSTFVPAFWYNLGRVISYTMAGFIVGAIGSVLTFTNTMQGILKLIAGIFMVIMGTNMLGIFPWFRRMNSRLPKVFSKRIHRQKGQSKSPILIGLLNGLMPCGPLQAMQIYALSTGNAFAGALSMFLFSTGTVPLMFGLGAVTSMLGKRFVYKVMTIGAVLVIVLGLSMFSQGWSLSGGPSPIDLISQEEQPANSEVIDIKDGVQYITSSMTGRSYAPILVQQGIPVMWTLNAPKNSINGCNDAIVIPTYDVQVSLKEGDNLIEFTPTETGTVTFTCWMGMIRSRIIVVDESENNAGQAGS